MDGIEKRSVVSQYFLGLDLGKDQDPSAIAVVERAELEGSFDKAVYAKRRVIELRLRKLQLLPLGTPFPEVEAWTRDVVASVARLGSCELAVDATGVGGPVVDHLRSSGLGCGMRAVKLTGGQVGRSEGEYDYVPKKDLIAGLEVLMEFGELKIASSLTMLAEFKKELAAMELRVTDAGNETFGARKDGEHDDMVIAVSLACWLAGKRYPGELSGERGHWVGGRVWK
jgi:hypothetical protein